MKRSFFPILLLLLLSSCNTKDNDTELLDLVSIRNWYKFEEELIEPNSFSVPIVDLRLERSLLDYYDTIPISPFFPRHSPRKRDLGWHIHLNENSRIRLTEEIVDTLESSESLTVKYLNDTIFANHQFDYLALHFKKNTSRLLQWNLKSEKKDSNFYVKVKKPSVFCKLDDIEAIFIVTEDSWTSIFDSRYDFACLYNVNDTLYHQKDMNSHLRDVLKKAGF